MKLPKDAERLVAAARRNGWDVIVADDNGVDRYTGVERYALVVSLASAAWDGDVCIRLAWDRPWPAPGRWRCAERSTWASVFSRDMENTILGECPTRDLEFRTTKGAIAALSNPTDLLADLRPYARGVEGTLGTPEESKVILRELHALREKARGWRRDELTRYIDEIKAGLPLLDRLAEETL